jgi:hypothetical protein
MQILLELIRHDLLTAFRTRRVLALVALHALIGLLTALAITSGVRALQQEVLAALVEQGVPAQAVHERVLDATEQRTLALLEGFNDDFPRYAAPFRSSIIIHGYFWLTLLAAPWLVALMSFDIFSTDLRARTFTFLTLRTGRTRLALARILSHTVLVLLIFTVIATLFVVTTAIRLPSHAASLSLGGIAWSLLLVSLYAVVWVTLASLASVTTSSPFRSLATLVFALTALAALRLSGPIASFFDLPAIAWLQYLSPSGHRSGLWFAMSPRLLFSIGSLTAFAALFGSLTLALFRRREL